MTEKTATEHGSTVNHEAEETSIPIPIPRAAGPEAHSERIYLERLHPDKHLEDFRELWLSPEGMKWSAKPPITDPTEMLPWMLSILPNTTNPDIDKFAIMLKTASPEAEREGEGEAEGEGQDKMIGLVGTNRWCKENEGVGMETGYCLNIEYWGKGYATEALRCFLSHFWTLGDRKEMNTLVSKVHPENIASLRVLQKCGARRGEVLEKVYERYIDDGVKCDLWCWYFDRPGSETD